MDTRKTYPIPAPGVDVLRTLAREVSDSAQALAIAKDTSDRAVSRNAAVQAALCAALGIAPGTGVTLDFTSGAFIAGDSVPGAPESPPYEAV